MKKQMKRTRRATFEYHADRSRELLKVFNEELGFSHYDSVLDVVQRVVNRPSSRFWVPRSALVRRWPLTTR
jgi:hypothetical protein